MDEMTLDAYRRLVGLEPLDLSEMPYGSDTEAKAEPDSMGEPRFKSNTERRAWYEWVPMQDAAIAKYEPVVFHLVGKHNYTPDIQLVFSDGRMWWIDVKGSWKAKNQRAGLIKLKQASEEYRYMGRWFALFWRDHEWVLKEYNK